MNDYERPGLREVDPATGFKWQWQPLPGYADPDQPDIASNPSFDSNRDGKPDSWPRDWYNETLGEYVWPGYLVQGENNADLEAFFVMDDRDNKEFNYFPYTQDNSKQGLGVQIDARAFQWSNSLAANSIFFVWSITNVSDTPLDSVVFGIYGDPDIGGVIIKMTMGFLYHLLTQQYRFIQEIWYISLIQMVWEIREESLVIWDVNFLNRRATQVMELIMMTTE